MCLKTGLDGQYIFRLSSHFKLIKMKKAEIIEQLDHKFNEFLHFFEQQEDSFFDHPIDQDKWSFGQHAEHILISTKAVNKIMKMPKLMLRTTFGVKNDRPEKDYDGVVEKYTSKLAERLPAATNPPGTRFSPSEPGAKSKSEIISELEKAFSDMKIQVGKWKEEHLTKYLIPHPLLGKMTFREILYFTIYHTRHHLQAMKSASAVVG